MVFLRKEPRQNLYLLISKERTHPHQSGSIHHLQLGFWNYTRPGLALHETSLDRMLARWENTVTAFYDTRQSGCSMFAITDCVA